MTEEKKRTMKIAGFKEEVAAVECGFCPLCRLPVCNADFKNEEERKRYDRNGTCSDCQNGMI